MIEDQYTHNYQHRDFSSIKRVLSVADINCTMQYYLLVKIMHDKNFDNQLMVTEVTSVIMTIPFGGTLSSFSSKFFMLSLKSHLNVIILHLCGLGLQWCLCWILWFSIFFVNFPDVFLLLLDLSLSSDLSIFFTLLRIMFWTVLVHRLFYILLSLVIAIQCIMIKSMHVVQLF